MEQEYRIDPLHNNLSAVILIFWATAKPKIPQQILCIKLSEFLLRLARKIFKFQRENYYAVGLGYRNARRLVVFFVALYSMFYILVPSFVLAGADMPPKCTGTNDPPDCVLITDINDVTTATTKIVVWLYNMFWVVAVGFVIWAAFMFMTANGDPTKVEKAKMMIIYTLIAAGVVLLVNGLRDIVTSLLKGET